MVYVYECMLPERSTLSSIHDVTHKPAPYGTIEGTKRQSPIRMVIIQVPAGRSRLCLVGLLSVVGLSFTVAPTYWFY